MDSPSSPARQLWNEFLDKCEFIYLTSHPRGVPFDWLEQLGDFTPEDHLEAELLERLPQAGSEGFRELFGEFVERRAQLTLVSDPRLPLRLVLGDPTAQDGDALLVPHDSDYVGPYAVKRAGLGEQYEARLVERPTIVEVEAMPFARLVLLPRLVKARARALREHCRAGLEAAVEAGARTLVLTHIPCVSPDFSNDFAAAEVISAAREVLRQHPGTRIRLCIFQRAIYALYRRWLQALHSSAAPETEEPGPETARAPSGTPGFARTAGEVLTDGLSAGRSVFIGVAERLRTSGIRKTITSLAGNLPLQPVAARTSEVRQALAYLELGSHEGALRELLKLEGRGFDPVLPAFLTGVVLYDKSLRQPDDSSLEEAATRTHRLRRSVELTPEAQVAIDLLLALCLRVAGRDEQASGWLEGARQAAAVLEERSYDEIFPALAAVFSGESEAVVRWQGTARVPDAPEEVILPMHLEAIHSRLF